MSTGGWGIPSRLLWPRWGMVAVGVLGVSLGLGWNIWPRSEANTGELAAGVTALPVSTLTVEPTDSYRVQRAYTGQIQAKRSSDLGFERDGEVVQVMVSEGMEVQAGSLIAQLDTRTLMAERQGLVAQLAVAQAQLQELRAGPRRETVASATASVEDIRQQLRLAQTLQSRREALYREGAISRQQLDESIYQVGSLEARLVAVQQQEQELQMGTRPEQITAQQARVQQLQASVTSVDVALQKTRLVAPFSGRIAARLVDEGTVVGSGQAVVRLVESGVWEARIGVPSQQLAALELGSRHPLIVGEQRWTGTVRSHLPEVDAVSRTVTVLLDVEASGIPSGQTVRLEVAEDIPIAGYWLPLTALVPGSRGLWTVYTVAPAESQPDLGQVQRQDVELVHSETERVFVRGTLQPGDRVIDQGSQRLVPGQLVSLFTP